METITTHCHDHGYHGSWHFASVCHRREPAGYPQRCRYLHRGSRRLGLRQALHALGGSPSGPGRQIGPFWGGSSFRLSPSYFSASASMDSAPF